MRVYDREESMDIEATVRADMAREAAGGSAQQQFGQSGSGLAFGFWSNWRRSKNILVLLSPLLVQWSSRGAFNLGESE